MRNLANARLAQCPEFTKCSVLARSSITLNLERGAYKSFP